MSDKPFRVVTDQTLADDKFTVAMRIANALEPSCRAIKVNDTGLITIHMEDNTVAQLTLSHWDTGE